MLIYSKLTSTHFFPIFLFDPFLRMPEDQKFSVSGEIKRKHWEEMGQREHDDINEHSPDIFSDNFRYSCHWSLFIPPENIRKPLVFLCFQEV